MHQIQSHDNSSILPTITVSVIGCWDRYERRYAQRLKNLLQQLLRDKHVSFIVLTLRTAEEIDIPTDNDRVLVLTNSLTKNAGRNSSQRLHNFAFEYCRTPYFCILSLDTVLREDSMSNLLQELIATDSAVAGPKIISSMGLHEATWGSFPTLARVLKSVLVRQTTVFEPQQDQTTFFPDWISHICMLFRSSSFHRVGGFDKRMSPHFEDVDICARLRKGGDKVLATTKATVIHYEQTARHSERHSSYGYFKCLAKLWLRYCFRLP